MMNWMSFAVGALSIGRKKRSSNTPKVDIRVRWATAEELEMCSGKMAELFNLMRTNSKDAHQFEVYMIDYLFQSNRKQLIEVQMQKDRGI